MVEKDVPKVVQAMRQTQSRKVLFKLLTRVKVCPALYQWVPCLTYVGNKQLTEDQSALRQVMRLRGFSLMTNILEDYEKDIDIITLVSLGSSTLTC